MTNEERLERMSFLREMIRADIAAIRRFKPRSATVRRGILGRNLRELNVLRRQEATSLYMPLVCGECEDCHAGECETHRTFICAGCELLVSWEDGCADDEPELCSHCWCVVHGEYPRRWSEET